MSGKSSNKNTSQEDLFRSIVQDQTEMIVRWKPGGIRTFVNKAYCEQFGLSEEEAIGTSFFSLISDKDFKSVKERFNQCTPEYPVHTAIHQVYNPDGSMGFQQWTDRAFFNEKGEVIEYQSVGRDITKEKIARDKLKENEERLSLIFNNTSDFMYLLRVEGRKYIIESVNESFVKAYNEMGVRLTSEEFIGLSLEDFWIGHLNYNNEIIKFKRSKLSQAVNKLHPVKYEDSIGLGDRACKGETTITPICKNDKAKKLLVVFVDLTEQIDALNELQKLKSQLETENIYLREEVESDHNFDQMVFKSQSFRSVLRLTKQVAPYDTTVLITGESGTGKELVARSIHKNSKRSNRSMIRVNCGAIPKDLVESELFGYVKGAFTGATADKAGKFQLADGGTIMLDEIGELPLESQVKLLRVLQEGELEPIGSVKTIKIDVRIISATNRNLEEEVRSGTFRSDLYFRLSTFPIHIPPLRERPTDIPPLVRFFVNKYGQKYNKTITTVSKKAMNHFVEYSWPGNIRELENVIERSVILSNYETLNVFGFNETGNVSLIEDSPNTLDEIQRNHIEQTLISKNWKIEGNEGAALALGIPPSTLRDRIKKYQIKKTT
ncbi:MAG: sigma 54-interacting transcriptional regulator [Bacteroidota bacterium]